MARSDGTEGAVTISRGGLNGRAASGGGARGGAGGGGRGFQNAMRRHGAARVRRRGREAQGGLFWTRANGKRQNAAGRVGDDV